MMGDALVKVTKINKEVLVGVSLGCSNCEMEFRFLRGESQQVDPQPWPFGDYTLAFLESCLEESLVRGLWREDCSIGADSFSKFDLSNFDAMSRISSTYGRKLA